MKATINGKRYDTERCETLGEKVHWKNGNYAGTVSLMRAKDGTLLVWREGNGQDCYFMDRLNLLEDDLFTIDDFELDDDQETRCAELGLIKIV